MAHGYTTGLEKLECCLGVLVVHLNLQIEELDVLGADFVAMAVENRHRPGEYSLVIQTEVRVLVDRSRANAPLNLGGRDLCDELLHELDEVGRGHT